MFYFSSYIPSIVKNEPTAAGAGSAGSGERHILGSGASVEATASSAPATGTGGGIALPAQAGQPRPTGLKGHRRYTQNQWDSLYEFIMVRYRIVLAPGSNRDISQKYKMGDISKGVATKYVYTSKCDVLDRIHYGPGWRQVRIQTFLKNRN